MNNKNKKQTNLPTLEALAALKNICDAASGSCRGERIGDFNFSDPECFGGEIAREDWPKGLAAFLDGCDWELSASEHNLILNTLEKHWKMPREWGVNIWPKERSIDAAPVDDPDTQER